MRFLSLALLAAFVPAQLLFSQTVAGLAGISGVVRDSSGAVVAGAKVVVANDSKGIRRNLETNDAGVFTAPALVPSPGYSVIVNKEGFAQFERRNMELQVGQSLNLDVTIEVAASATQVQVVEAAPLVESTKSGVSQVVGTKQIDNLPINGRRVDSFVLLTPAVVPDGTFGLVSFRGIAGGNAFLTDGNDTTNQFYNENAGRTRISSQISQDAVQEFQVLSNGYSAEFGRASGGVINTVTRSGSNDVHGTAYWFFRNQDFNARDRYAPFNPPESRHQGGGSIGGPIKKDRLFYFFNGEATRRNFPGLNRLINQSYTDTAGVFNAPCTAAGAPVQPTAAQCTAARDYMMRGNNVQIERTANSELLFGKLDWRPSDRNQFSASLNYLRWVSPNGIQTQAVLTNNNLLSNNANSTVRTRYGRLAWTAVPTNTSVNELRFGWFKDRLFDDVNDALVPPQTGRLGVQVAGTPVGTATDYPRLNPSENRYQLADTLNLYRGKHSLKAGFDLVNTQDYLKILRNQFGTYTYATFGSFALDFTGTPGRNYQTFTQTFGNPVLDFSIRDYAFFVQDQIRATAKLTLNVGVRYEYSQLPQPTQVNPDYPQTGKIHSPKSNWGPRVGLAYSFNDRTVLRSGFGLFYGRFPGSLIQTLYLSNGLYQPQIQVTPTSAGAPVFPNILSSLTGLPQGNVSVTFAGPDFRNPYTMQGDLAIERELTRNLVLTVSYIWSRGVQINTTRDLNIGALGAPVTYRILDASGNQTGSYSTPTYLAANRVDRRYQRVVQVENGGQTWYNGLVAQLNKRFSHGLQASTSYTWSHAIDTANQGGGNNALFFDQVRSTFNGDYSGDKGSSQLDIRHRFVFNSLWTPTFTKSTSKAAKWLINGWQLSQITTLQSTPPFTTTLRVVGTPFAGSAFPQTLNGLGGSTRVPFLPFSNLDVDQVYRIDARLTRELPISERVKGYFNFEVFNVFNLVANTAVLSEAFQTTAANSLAIRPTPGLGTGNQSQGFPDGTNARRAQISLRLVF